MVVSQVEICACPRTGAGGYRQREEHPEPRPLRQLHCLGCDMPSVQTRQATSQNLLQLLSRLSFICKFLALLTCDVCIGVLHALFLNAPNSSRLAYRLLSLPKLEIEPFNHLLVSPDSCLRGELVLSLHALQTGRGSGIEFPRLSTQGLRSRLLTDRRDMFHLDD